MCRRAYVGEWLRSCAWHEWIVTCINSANWSPATIYLACLTMHWYCMSFSLYLHVMCRLSCLVTHLLLGESWAQQGCAAQFLYICVAKLWAHWSTCTILDVRSTCVSSMWWLMVVPSYKSNVSHLHGNSMCGTTCACSNVSMALEDCDMLQFSSWPPPLAYLACLWLHWLCKQVVVALHD